MQRAFLSLLLVSTLFVLAGCQRVREDKTFTMEPGLIRTLEVPGFRSQQKIRVEVKGDQPIDVDVALESKSGGIVGQLELGKRPPESDLLASKLKTTGDMLEFTVPAGQVFKVFLSGATKRGK